MSRLAPHRSVLAVVAATALLGAAYVAAPDVALLLAPGVFLAGALAAGCFPGERIVRRVWATSPRPRRRHAAPIEPTRRPALVRPCGVTFAFALAMRPPPAPSRP
ncbi:MAG: hypothetical protein M0P31_04330 [Solirubrobacteraceae bacterium]|nr:hypothetical protein [Solirubrobacteraceae bacterium]